MGELYDTLDEFQEISREYYGKIMEIMEDKYCWKCPMRSTSKEALCREVDAWVRLTQSLEWGIREQLQGQNLSLENLEVVATRFLEKRMKTLQPKVNEPEVSELFFQLENENRPFAQTGDFIRVKTNPKRVKVDDLVLLPQACPLATYWYPKATAKIKVPFKIFRVSRVFSKKGVKYFQTEEGLEVPVEFLMGVVLEIINKETSPSQE